MPENATLIRDNIPDRIQDMQAGPSGDMLLFAGPEELRPFFEHVLTDEIATILCPVTLGDGKRLFPHPGKRTDFRLTYSEVFPSGGIALRYVPDT